MGKAKLQLRYWRAHEETEEDANVLRVSLDDFLSTISAEEVLMFLQGDGVPTHFVSRMLVQDHSADKFILVHVDKLEDMSTELLLHPLSAAETANRVYKLTVLLQFAPHVKCTKATLTVSLVNAGAIFAVEQVHTENNEISWSNMRVFDPELDGFMTIREKYLFNLQAESVALPPDPPTPGVNSGRPSLEEQSRESLPKDQRARSLVQDVFQRDEAKCRHSEDRPRLNVVQSLRENNPAWHRHSVDGDSSHPPPHSSSATPALPSPAKPKQGRLSFRDESGAQTKHFVQLRLETYLVMDSTLHEVATSPPSSISAGGPSQSASPGTGTGDSRSGVARHCPEDSFVIVSNEDISHMCSEFVDAELFQNFALGESVDRNEARFLRWASVTIPENPAQVHPKLKNLVRRGVPDHHRREVWCCLSGASILRATRPDLMKKASAGAFRDIPFRSAQPRSEVVPHFGADPRWQTDHLLNSEGILAAKKILCLVSQQFPSLDSCPALPDTICLLLMYMDEEEVFFAVYNMLQKSISAQWYFRNSNKSQLVFEASFVKLLANKFSSLYQHSSNLGIMWEPIVRDWFRRLFVSKIPFSASLRMLDAFLHEGNKILYRYALALIQLHKPALMNARTPPEFFEVLEKMVDHTNVDELSKRAFKLSLSRKELARLDESFSDLPMSRQDATTTYNSVYYKPTVDSPSKIATEENLELLWSWLPSRLRIRDLRLIFATYSHGYSLNTVYNCCEEVGDCPCLMLLQGCHKSMIAGRDEASGEIQLSESEHPEHREIYSMGAFCSSTWHRSFAFYGNADTFLFSLGPGPEKCYRWGKYTHEQNPSVLAEVNDYFMMGTNDGIVMGGGGSGASLRVEADLMRGSTYTSNTFLNEPLCPLHHFEILKLELYTFV